MYKITKQGIAVDIDETLSDTTKYWFDEISKLANPENLSPEEIKKKYRYTHQVPYWQTEEISNWLDGKLKDNELQKELLLIENSNLLLQKINELIPVVAYITARPEIVAEGTKHWLDKHNFPKAKLICKPNNETLGGNEWKANILKDMYPQVLGIIDDNPKLAEALGEDYKGVLFLYDHEEIKSNANVVSCLTWEDVYKNVLNYFKK